MAFLLFQQNLIAAMACIMPLPFPGFIPNPGRFCLFPDLFFQKPRAIPAYDRGINSLPYPQDTILHMSMFLQYPFTCNIKRNPLFIAMLREPGKSPAYLSAPAVRCPASVMLVKSYGISRIKLRLHSSFRRNQKHRPWFVKPIIPFAV